MTFYRANRDNTRYRHRKVLYNLESLYESGLIQEIDELNRPDAVVLFGSYLDGTDTEKSDIDIAVINGRNKDMETENLSEQLNREIQLTHIDNPQEENREFRNTLANGYILHGYLELVS